MENNIVKMTDSYKITHWNQYPEGTEKVESYMESRTGAEFPYTVFFGLQMILKNYLVGQVVTTAKIDAAEKFSARHFGNDAIFNRARWDYIVEHHDGKLPLKIMAVPEGTPVTISNVMMTVVNTDEKNCYWLTNHVETILTHVWHGSTVATLSRFTKEGIMERLEKTCDQGSSFPGLDFMLHDFGMRGVSSLESAGVGGAGHLINFLGTDNIPACDYVEYYYGEETGYSVPATEHSVMTSLGKEGEDLVIDSLLEKHPTGILSVVSDSYDIYKLTEKYGTVFKDRILARDGKLVVRPDSVDHGLTPSDVMNHIMFILDKYFGSTVNSKGYKVLNPKVGVMWGDGIDRVGINEIMDEMIANGWSVENFVFGMGGGLLQKINRDTQRNAFKSSAQKRNGIWYDIFKDPLDKSKMSKKGRLKLVKENGEYKTVDISEPGENLLKTVFLNGELVKEYTFAEIKNNASI